MAILNIQPTYRLRVPTFYTAAPPRPGINEFPPTPTSYTNRNGVLSTDIARTARAIELVYQNPPKSVLVIDPAPAGKVKYYVYDPRVAFVGNVAVQTVGGVRVVYLTPEQAKFHTTTFVIGLLPWEVLTYPNRQLISKFFKEYFSADLPPVVNVPLVDKTGTVSVALTPYQFPANSFWDPDDHSKTLTYSAKRIASNGKDTDLPSWLSFNPSTRTFSGTPPTGSQGTYNIRVYATDPWGRSVYDVFTYTISP